MIPPASTGLFELREALRGHGPASAAELAQRLQRQPAIVQAMLDHWQRRGRVRIVDPAVAPAGDTLPGGASRSAPQPAALQVGASPRKAAGGCGSGACSSCGSCAGAAPAAGGARADRLPPARYAWCEQRVVGMLGVAAGAG